MMVLWVNLHGGFLLGFLIVGVFCGAALLRRDWVNFKIYSFAGVGCFIAIFINPLGWHIYDGVAATLGHFVQADITEWFSYYQNMTVPGSIPGMVYILIFVALELRYRSSGPMESGCFPGSFCFWDFINLDTCLSFYVLDGSVGSSPGSAAT